MTGKFFGVLFSYSNSKRRNKRDSCFLSTKNKRGSNSKKIILL